MDWNISMSKDGATHVARLVVDRVTFKFYGPSRAEAWVLALRQLVEIHKSARVAEFAVNVIELQEAKWN